MSTDPCLPHHPGGPSHASRRIGPPPQPSIPFDRHARPRPEKEQRPVLFPRHFFSRQLAFTYAARILERFRACAIRSTRLVAGFSCLPLLHELSPDRASGINHIEKRPKRENNRIDYLAQAKPPQCSSSSCVASTHFAAKSRAMKASRPNATTAETCLHVC